MGHIPPKVYIVRSVSFVPLEVENENAEARKFAFVSEIDWTEYPGTIDISFQVPLPEFLLEDEASLGLNNQNEGLSSQDPA